MTLLQLAIDTGTADEAIALAGRLSSYVDVIEAGTPLIKRHGISLVTHLRATASDALILADMKTMDAGALEAEMAFKAGADLMTVLACASDATIGGALEVARRHGGRIVADLLGVAPDRKAERSRELAALGVDFLGVHAGTDARGDDRSGPLAELAVVRGAVNTPVAVAGGLSLNTLGPVLNYAPEIVIVGSAITCAKDPASEAVAIQASIRRNDSRRAMAP